jgi:RNA binding exosome subunit
VIHRITFRAFVATTEDEERVRDALSIFVPRDNITATSAKGHFGNQIKILDATLKRRDGQAFFQLLKEQISPEERARLTREVRERVDLEGKFHLRLDK